MQPETAKLDAEASRCVQCGLCVPKCPTYQLTRNEADSPRGRIAIMRAVWGGRMELTGRAQAHLDGCLTCRACEAACPSGVQYGQLIDGIRPALAQTIALPAPVRVLQQLVQRPSLLRFASRFGRAAKRAGLKGGMLRSLPAESASFAPGKSYSAVAPARGEVDLFIGCVGSSVDAASIEAAIRLLNQLGFTVHVSAGQTCCGALHQHSGQPAVSASLLQLNAEAFGAETRPLLFLASGCGVQLREGLPALDIKDVMQFIAQHWRDDVVLQPLAASVRVHEPCSQRNVLKSQQAVYTLLQKIPQLDVQPLAGNETCCGAAGSYYLTHPQVAQTLRDGKMRALTAATPDWLVSSNIGCALWLAQGMVEPADTPAVPVVHPLVLLERQLRDEHAQTG